MESKAPKPQTKEADTLNDFLVSFIFSSCCFLLKNMTVWVDVDFARYLLNKSY